ncbi:GPI-anchored protein Ecm33 [Aspergillus glaucus CBS 516.65]|uniref:GPI-anchored cell wall organization protein Ecm33 n=1 Tax=Aspergillus glaucus CBS 516.65 TaxID=1160497 RepID=A0A1L9VT68_ASPGL|nr:hypothetical protein ASPGLDRAFT_119615 [Aspergillus glaucus CBS 516.65]OJJ87095.1 hypothetical protein ASPGLDRAFT_119615 [Aspergillus glaucus CBS 516.65]
MAFLKYALPVLAASQLALGSSCGEGKTIKISSQSDIDGYSSCKTLKGDVEISEEVADTLSFNNVEKITGGFSCTGASNLTSLTAPNLGEIGDIFKLDGLTGLYTLNFGALSSVGSIKFTALPQLQKLEFATGVSEAGNVAITNTGLSSLDGISLNKVGDFDITENTNLKTVNVNNLTEATGLINFAGNMDSLEIELPNLASGTNMTFRNVSSVSVPSLHNLTGQMGFWGDSFKTFSAPNLTETGDLAFNNNAKLSNLSMPQLETVNGGFQIMRNDKLANISFPSLETITGAIDFSGAFDSVDIPELSNVKGGFNMQSTGDFDCDGFDKKHKDKVIRGSYTCSAKKSNPKSKNGQSGTSSGTSSAASGTSTSSEGAAPANIANVPAMGMAAIFGALLQLAM